MANKAKDEPKTAPQFDRWYNLSLGSSFNDDSSSNKYSTLRFIDEFKPASVDQSKPGKLHKNKDNRVSVEFQNSQVGKPKVVFEGSSEDYKENEAVLFFDGETFRLERIHRAVKSLRHVRLPGEAAASASNAAQGGPGLEPKLSPVGKQQPKTVNLGSSKFHIVPPPHVPIEVERINVGYAETSGSGSKPSGRRDEDRSYDPPNISVSPAPKDDEAEENQEIVMEDLFGTPDNGDASEDKDDIGFDINVPRQNDSDDEIADVEDSGDEAGKGPNAAEALRAQVDAEEEKDEQSSSSGSSSGSGSSGSGSGSGSSSSSSDGEESDDVSVNSI